MKKVGKILLLLLLFLPLSGAAQVRFGYMSYRTLCQEMPAYAAGQQELQRMREVYEKEAQRSEEEFQRKFADFLQGQKDFPANILHKRQAELQELMDRGVKFRKEAEQLLLDAERQFMQDLQKKLDEAIAAVGTEMGYAFILNTDDNACPFINPLLGDEVSNPVRQKLGLPVVEAPAVESPVDGGQSSETPQQPAADALPPIESVRP